MNLRQIVDNAISGYRLANTVREQIEVLLDSVERLIISNTIVVLFTTLAFAGSAAFPYARNWCLGVMISLLATSMVARRMRSRSWSNEDAPAIAKNLVAMAGLRGIFWSVGFATLLPMANPAQTYLLEMVILGMMVGGIFAYWSLPSAALLFSGLIFSGAALGLVNTNLESRNALLFAMSVSFLFFNRIALSHTTALRKQIETAGHLRAEQEVVSLLLRDFEDNSKDWLWQTDYTGMLTRGQIEFSAALPEIQSELSAMPLVESLTVLAQTEAQRQGIETLHEALSGQQSFSDVEVIFGKCEDSVHLMLSAKPRLLASGEFAGWHGVASNISAERKAEARVRHLAHFDSLTGLPNRTQLRAQLDKDIATNLPKQQWMLYGDLDGFKLVNDTLGHGAGDVVLCELANRFSSHMQEGEMVARIGGDEFVFVLQREENAIENIWQALVAAAAAPMMVQGQTLVVGISIGIVAIDGGTDNVDELLRRADLALYNAKQQGKGTARYYQRSMDEIAMQRRAMERELRAAIASKNFEIHYQPIYACKDGHLQSYEALLRWTHPQQGPISPAVFIPLAEECGLINDLGAWVLRRACEDAKSFPNGVRVSVNISTIQLGARRLLADVTRALDESRLLPSRLELEMTESALMENVEFAKSMIDDLKALGVGVALDDFGTGYSSLAYIHRFRFDRIKIDRSFVQAYGLRSESRAVVDAVVMIARQLGIGITAEGIETTAQYDAMVERGCDLAQGYLLGRPASIQTLQKINATG